MTNEIVRRCALLTPVYTDPNLFQVMCENWFHVKQWNIARMWRLVNEEYNPLHNYDRHESRDIDRKRGRHEQEDVETSGSSHDESTGRDDRNESRTTDRTFVGKELTSSDSNVDEITSSDSNTSQSNTTTSDSNDTKELTKSAFNASTYQPVEKQTDVTNNNAHGETTGDDHADGTRNTKGTDSGDKDTNNDENEDVTISGGGTTAGSTNGTSESSVNRGTTENESEQTGEAAYMYGNIGVTTSQQMFQAEVALLKTFNIYEVVAQMFENDMFLIVY